MPDNTLGSIDTFGLSEEAFPFQPERPIQPPRQDQQPEDPAMFFESGPGISFNDPLYKPDREAWYNDFVKGYYNQKMDTLEDYVRFVKSMGTDPGIDSFVKQQALKHMPPKVKQQYEELQEEKKADRARKKREAEVAEWNERPENKSMQARLDMDGKVTYLKTDPELDRWNKQADNYNKLIKTIQDTLTKLKAQEFTNKTGDSKEFQGPRPSEALERNLERQLFDVTRKYSATLDKMAEISMGKEERQMPTPEEARMILEERRQAALSAQR